MTAAPLFYEWSWRILSFHPLGTHRGQFSRDDDEVIGPANIKDRPIYLLHGLHDWMFDVAIARVARDVLAEAGAEVVYREIPDLAHTYPRDENAKILDWFLA